MGMLLKLKFLESPSRQPHVLPLNAPPTLITAGTSVSITPDLLATETLNTRKYESESDAIEKSIDDVSSSEHGKTVTERKAKAEEEELKRPIGEFTYKHSFPSIGWSRSLLSLVYLVLSGVAIKLTELLITYWTSPISKGDNEVNPLFWDSTGCWQESKSLFGTSPSGSNNIPHEKQDHRGLRKVELWSLIESKRGSDASWMQNSFHEPATFCPVRAIIQKNKIVVLDEVSSSIDVATDKLVQRVVREAFAGATIQLPRSLYPAAIEDAPFPIMQSTQWISACLLILLI
ncbi:hypothetical protein V1505DRAFT_358446 [Lipomyces doorenjongii]